MTRYSARAGALWMLLSCVGFSTMGVLVKLSGVAFALPQQLFLRSLTLLLIVTVMIVATRCPLRTNNWRLHLGRSLFGFCGMALFFYCIGKLPLATAVTLNRTSVLFLLLLTWLFLREPAARVQVLAVGIGFSGIVVLLGPVFDSQMRTVALLGVASGFLVALSGLTLRMLGTRGQPVWQVVFYFSLFSTVASGFWTLFEGRWSAQAGDYLPLIGAGFAAALGQYATTSAHRSASPAVVATLSNFTLILTSAYGVLLFSELLGLNAWVGIALVIVGGLLTVVPGLRQELVRR